MKRMSILLQLIMGFSLIVLCIFPATSYISYRVSSDSLLERSSQHLQESVVSLEGKIDFLLQEYDRLSLMISFGSEIQEYLRSVHRGTESKHSKQDMNGILSRQSRYGGNRFIMQIMDTKGSLYNSNMNISMLWDKKEQIESQRWYMDSLQLAGEIRWFSGIAWHFGKTPAVIGLRQINDYTDMRRLGDMFVTLPVINLAEILEDSKQDSIVKLYIIDYLGSIVYSLDPDEIGAPAPSSLTDLKSGKSEGLTKLIMDQNEYYVSYSTSEYSGLTTMAFIEPETIVQDIQKTQYVTIIAVVAGTLLSIIMIVFFSWTVTNPIRYLSHRLSRIRNGNLVVIKDKQSNKELQNLVNSYNQMTDQLNGTIEELSAAKISQQEARIIALRAQFRPHFLYNTLNTIYWVLSNEGQERSADMVLKLSDLLRYSIQPGSEMVTMKEDLDQLERFLSLQKMRYGDVLHYSIDIPGSLYDQKVMQMLFQPVVENAITHGLEQVYDRDWEIHIRASVTNNKLHIIIEDNGIGMNEEEMAAFNRNEPLGNGSVGTHSGLGLQNLKNRLLYIYGLSYELILSRGELGGLRVDLILPGLLSNQEEGRG